MFKKVLIANRGAIATRIIRTLKKMNITSVALYSEADADSLHVRLADEAYSLGAGAASLTYLNTEKIFEIAKSANIEAIHPGYGFLSENADFVAGCNKHGIQFIGPRTEHLQMFGLKHEARQLAEKHKVPLLPGSPLLTDIDSAVDYAEKIGYPVILKSTAGGGGIGMQICNNQSALRSCFNSIKRLGANNFANDGVFVEKYVEFARHIEVQVFGDGLGRAVAFGERDCSAQRRHQKVIEETPAPNIPADVREELQATAVKLLAGVEYQSAGTVEYIYDQQTNDFYFLEVNTRLQVEHGVTEEVFGIDLVEWMIKLAAAELDNIEELRKHFKPRGHAIQARVYAEDPNHDFQPSAGLLSSVALPETSDKIRIDHWIDAGLEVSPFFDPMLAKVICKSDSREQAIEQLSQALSESKIQGIETNLVYLQQLLASPTLREGKLYTRFLNGFDYSPATIDVLAGGTLTTIQDFPGRTGYWDVGVPPSGPFDCLSFRLGNRLLGNDDSAAGLEITLNGPSLKFNCNKSFVLTGAHFDAWLDDTSIDFNQVYEAKAGQTLSIGKVQSAGARAYLLVAGGIDGNHYLGSKSTFTLGQFGGFSGRSLRTGDVVHLCTSPTKQKAPSLDQALQAKISNDWEIRVIYGPHGAPGFFTAHDIETFFSHKWEVHYNSSRTGIRLIGPKPEWARESGGEAGMHPSNIHDNAYAIGTIDFTGDMPVILGPDGPSLGGFVCPATVITADLWKLGQLKAGDHVHFIPVSSDTAKTIEVQQNLEIQTLKKTSALDSYPRADVTKSSPIVFQQPAEGSNPALTYRISGDKYLLVEYGPQVLDLRLRIRVHALMHQLQLLEHESILELTPGIRSLQIHYDNLALPLDQLIELLKDLEKQLDENSDVSIPSRIVHLPLSWNDQACKLAVEKYMQGVRSDAPWCPDNIEFIRRINGLNSVNEVKDIVFSTEYVVMGLGDVYLGAPVATPLDPRKRLITTKYNPARTWTAENSVGIGGAYLCIYGMEGPGGYQFVGRTLQMWNKYRTTSEFSKPWLLRFFDQIRFYPVSAEELLDIRKKFPRGDYPLKIENTHFKLRDYENYLQQNADSIAAFRAQQKTAFDKELHHWHASGQFNYSSDPHDEPASDETILPDNATAIESHVAGSIWQWQAKVGDWVKKGQVIGVLESMKMEIELIAPCDGEILSITREAGQQVHAGQVLGALQHD